MKFGESEVLASLIPGEKKTVNVVVLLKPGRIYCIFQLYFIPNRNIYLLFFFKKNKKIK